MQPPARRRTPEAKPAGRRRRMLASSRWCHGVTLHCNARASLSISHPVTHTRGMRRSSQAGALGQTTVLGDTQIHWFHAQVVVMCNEQHRDERPADTCGQYVHGPACPRGQALFQ
jgi:hypothetical protein